MTTVEGLTQPALRRLKALISNGRRYLPLTGLPPGQRRARVLTATGALVVGALVGGAPIVAGGAPAGAQSAAGLAGLLALCCGLLGWVPGIGWSVGLLAADYAVALVGKAGTDPAAPLEAAGLVLVAELAAWSLECRTRATDSHGIFAWRVRRLIVIEAVALSAGVAVLAAANLPAHGGTTLGAIGVASAVTVLALAALLLGRLRRGRELSG